jgi:hypothetical protein
MLLGACQTLGVQHSLCCLPCAKKEASAGGVGRLLRPIGSVVKPL